MRFEPEGRDVMSQLTPSTVHREPRVALTADQRHSLVAIGMGNLIEWFDWALYSTFAVYIAATYFSSDNPTSALLSTLAVFAAGFVARPFGGILFGWIADRKGRKFAMTLAVGLMSAGSVVIAISPSFTTIGAAASAILVIARLTQGVSQGGETPASFAFLGELAPAARRGYWSSLIYVSGVAGILLTVLLGVILNAALSPEQMAEFGWRIPFGVGAILGIYTLWMRRTMNESQVFDRSRAEGKAGQPGILRNAIRYRRELLTVVGLTVGFTTAYYAWVVNAPTYANVTLGFDREATLWANAIANVCLIIALPLWGKLSDKIGRKPILVISFGALLVLYLPAFFLMQQSIIHFTIVLVVISVLMAGIPAIFPAVLSEMLPTNVRATGIGFPYALAVAVFGGTAPYIQQLAAATNEGFNFFPVYVMALVLVSLIVSFVIPETKGKALID
jgi:MHS family alpha-ketoglutarate permease-like MFS transporter